MDSQKTTHILLAIITVGMFFMIFLFMKERYFRDSDIGPVVWEETVPARPSTTPILTPVPPTPTPTSVPAPTPTPAPNAPLSGTTTTFTKGEKYTLLFETGNDVDMFYTYCYETQYQWIFSNNWQATDPCKNIPTEKKVLVAKINMSFSLKATTTEAMLSNLNNQYGVTTPSDQENFAHRTLEIPYYVGYTEDSYTLSKKYYATGYFKYVMPAMVTGVDEEY